jgi:ABC-type uncharacterized transport system involved in gliding motility auxiliary subunit
MLLENDQQTVRDIYMGLAFEYKGNKQSINLTQEIEGRLEYEITSLLRRLTKASLPKVTVFQDSLYNAEYYKYFEYHAGMNYQVMPTNLNAPVMASDVLIFPGVSDSISQLQLYNLDQYIMHGGKVLFLQDRLAGLVQYGNAQQIRSNVFNLLENYGIRIKPNLVLDRKCAPINMSQRSGIFVIDTPMPFPPIPMVDGARTSPVSKGLSGILIYLGSEINIKPDRQGLEVTPLLQTSAGSGILDGPDFDITPERFMGDKTMSSLMLPPLTLAAEFKGTFNSYFANLESAGSTQGFVPKTDKGQVIVVSDSDLIRDFIASASSSNIMFVLNAVDYLLGDVSMNEVRSRSVPNSPLDISEWLYRMDYPPAQIAQAEPVIRRAVKTANLVLPSLLLVAMGFIMIKSRKKARRIIQWRYEPVKHETEDKPETSGGETS